MKLSKYPYQGKRSDGSSARGEVIAFDRDDAVRKLLAQGITVVSMREPEAPPPIGDDKLRISGERLTLIYRQLATMYRAGIPLDRCFRFLAKGAELADTPMPTIQRGELKVRVREAPRKQTPEAQMCLGMAEALTRGLTLSQAMSLYPGVFGPPHVAMAKVGASGGIMPRILDELSVLTQRADSLHRKVRASTTYPIFVFVASLACVFGLFTFIMPQFLDLVKEMNVQLPLYTRILIGCAQVLGHPITLVLAGFLMFMWPQIWKRIRQRRQLQQLLDTGSARAIIFGQVTRKVSLARGMQILAALSRAGLNVRESLPMAAQACGNRMVGDALEEVSEQVIHGVPMATAMKAAREVFPPALVAYVESGEHAGQVPEMLVRASDMLTIDADLTLEALPELLEPLIIGFLGLVVGGIVVSVFVPLYATLKNI